MGIICGPGSFAVQYGIICGPGIICGTVWGSFAVLGSFADPYISPGAHPLIKKPEDSGYEIGLQSSYNEISTCNLQQIPAAKKMFFSSYETIGSKAVPHDFHM